jgi:hypothetical protein
MAHLVSLLDATVFPSVETETGMQAELKLTIYLVLALALASLRARAGSPPADALFRGLFWPVELTRCWIEVLVGRVLKAGATRRMA